MTTLTFAKIVGLIPLAMMRLLVLTTLKEVGRHDYDASKLLMQHYDFVIGKWWMGDGDGWIKKREMRKAEREKYGLTCRTYICNE